MQQNSVIETVRKTIKNYHMLQYGDSVLVSLSGGPDSIFLAHALLQLRDFYGLKIYCAHLDHMTRQGGSAKDADFVESFCRRLGLKLFKEQIDAGKWCIQNRFSFQEGARILRINFLSETVNANGIKKIAVGHTADDNLETFFINLLRGSGMRGLGGIRPVEKMFIRPIIECSRAEIIDYLEKNNLEYCIDKTNLENTYLRNKIRNLLLPFIRKNIKLGFEKAILNTIKILREEDKYLSELAGSYLEKEAIFKKAAKINKYSGLKNTEVKEENKHEKSFLQQQALKPEITGIEIPLSRLSQFPDAFKRRVIIAAVNAIMGGTADIKSASLQSCLEFAFASGENKTVSFADGIKVKKECDLLKIFISYGNGAVFLDKKAIKKYSIEPGKKIEADSLGIAVFSEILNIEEVKEKLSENRKNKDIEKLLKEKTNKAAEAYMDFDKVRFPVYLRTWKQKEGDSFMPFGMNKHKKLHDFFIDEKIPVSERIKIPVFLDEEKIIWVGRHRIDNRVKIKRKTKKILYIKIFDI